MKSPQGSNTNSSRNGKNSASAEDLKRLKEENGQIEQSLRLCRMQIEGLAAGHLIAFNLGLEPNYDSSWLLRKMEELTRRIEAHKEKEERFFEEAEKAAGGESPAP